MHAAFLSAIRETLSRASLEGLHRKAPNLAMASQALPGATDASRAFPGAYKDADGKLIMRPNGSRVPAAMGVD